MVLLQVSLSLPATVRCLQNLSLEITLTRKMDSGTASNPQNQLHWSTDHMQPTYLDEKMEVIKMYILFKSVKKCINPKYLLINH